MLERPPARAETRARHQPRSVAPIAASPRAPSHVRVAAVRAVTSGVRRRRAVLFNASSVRHRFFNRDRSVPSHGPRLRSAPVNVDGTAMARAFAHGMHDFSEKHTATTVNALLALQRIKAIVTLTPAVAPHGAPDASAGAGAPAHTPSRPICAPAAPEDTIHTIKPGLC